MLSLKATIRKERGRQTKALREEGILPAVLYGEGIKNLSLQVDAKEFEKIYQEAGESSLIPLKVEGKKFDVLIHQVSRDPLKGEFLHVDFYHPSSRKKVEAEIALVFKGTAPAVRDRGGILVKEIQTVEVKGLARNLPREIIVNVKDLRTFDDRLQVKDLIVPEGVDILRDKDDIVALVVPPTKEEEEKPSEEKPPEEEKPAEEKVEEEKKG